MVDHDHDRIKPRGRREVSDEVDRKLFKRERDGGLDWEQGGGDRMCVGLILLTNRTPGDEVFHKGGESQPPEIPL